jgi:iron complex outermembrane receptor protein
MAPSAVLLDPSMPHSHSSRSASSRGAALVLRPIVRHLAGIGLVMIAGNALAQTAQPAALGEVTVVGTSGTGLQPPAPGGQVARGGSLGLLGSDDAKNQPFSTVNFTSQALEDAQARTLADVVVNDASVRLTNGSNGFDDTFQIRGFAVSATDVGFNGLYGLISQNRVPAQLIERVEVLKGPGALINGIAPSGSVGGGINVVTKRASDVPLTRFTTLYTSKSNFGLAADIGRRFGIDNAWGLRFNGLVRGGEASIRDGDAKTQLGSLALDYQGSRLRWNLDAIVQRDDTDNFRPQISLNGLSAIPAAPDARSNWYPGTSLVQKDNTIATRLEYDVSDSLTAYAGIGYRDGSNDQSFPGSARGANGPVVANGNFNVQNSWYDSYTKTVSGNAGVRWKFNTGVVGHRVTAAVTQMKQESGFAYIVGATAPSNIYNPSPLPPIALPRTDPTKSSDTTLRSVAIADTLSFANDRVLVTVGVRDQTVEVESATGALPYKESAVSPLAGIVIKPLENVSIYGNYTAGLSRGATVGVGYTNTGANLAPYKSKQYEVGVKADFQGITTSAAIYQIDRPAAASDLGAPLPTYGYFGEQRNRGLELNAYGQIVRGLRGIASLSVVDAELTKTQGGTNQGNTAAGVPNSTMSLGLDWDTPWVQGLALNGRVIRTGPVNLTNTNQQRFDSWTRYDIGARYRTNISGKSVVFRANIENLFDKNYWLTTGTYVAVGSPRTFVLSASIDF